MWMMGNIYTRTNSIGNIKPDKEKSTEKKTVRLLPLWRSTVRFGAGMYLPKVCTMRGDCCFCNKNAEKQLFTASPENPAL